VTFPQIRDEVWSGAGSNRRPSAFQVNRAERCADLRKRTSLTSGTALGRRYEIHGSMARYTPSARQAVTDSTLCCWRETVMPCGPGESAGAVFGGRVACRIGHTRDHGGGTFLRGLRLAVDVPDAALLVL
jgi:hypothetical protein